MAIFANVIDFAINHEVNKGKPLLDDPSTGELSMYGITAPFLYENDPETWEAFQGDVRRLTRLEAIQTYQNYFNKLGLQTVNSDPVAAKFFDMCINMGSSRATVILQRSLQNFVPLSFDGILGPHTLQAINTVTVNVADGENLLLMQLAGNCTLFYKSIAVGPKAKYLEGWLVRAQDLPVGQKDV